MQYIWGHLPQKIAQIFPGNIAEIRVCPRVGELHQTVMYSTGPLPWPHPLHHYSENSLLTSLAS